MKLSPQYEYPAVAADSAYPELDKSIEDDSTEYTWSPDPELESSEPVQDTPEEEYDADMKRGESLQEKPANHLPLYTLFLLVIFETFLMCFVVDICHYLQEECDMYKENGLCKDRTLQAQGVTKLCKTKCGFCS